MKLSAIIFSFFFLPFTLFGNSTTVHLKENAVVYGKVIRLSDVAEVSGVHKGLLDTLVVGKATQPGYSRLLLRDELLLFNSSVTEIRKDVTLLGAARCSVKSSGKDIFYSDISSKIKSALHEELIWNQGNWDIEFQGADSNIVTLWDSEYEVSLGKLRSNSLKGKTKLPVVFTQGTDKSTLYLNVEISVKEKVLVATTDLVQGERIGASDYRWEKMDITYLPSQPVISFSLKDKYHVRSGVIKAGSVIMAKKVKKAKLIERGAPVTIISRVGTASVAISGRAREAGDLGDEIIVVNSGSRKIIRGIVMKPGVVQVRKGGEV